MDGDPRMKTMHRLLNRARASAVDFWHYLAGTGRYAPRERNPQTMETEMRPALLNTAPHKPLLTRRVGIAVALAVVVALTIATVGYVTSRPAPVPVCARYGIHCAPTHTPSPIRHADTSSATPKGQ